MGSRLVGSDLRIAIDSGRITGNPEAIHLAEKRAFCRSGVTEVDDFCGMRHQGLTS
jgi:hypothetical protein